MSNFGAAYQSTRDSRARLTGLAATGPRGLAARVTFVSHQNPAKARTTSRATAGTSPCS